jgi:hypothetical protein
MIPDRGRALLVIAGSALCWLAARLTGSHGTLVSPGVMTALRCAAAVALVLMASVLVASAVRVVSRPRWVVRASHRRDDDEPPLPYHEPEPEETGDDAWTPLPASRQASALPLPGRAPAVPPKQVMTSGPDPREVPR